MSISSERILRNRVTRLGGAMRVLLLGVLAWALAGCTGSPLAPFSTGTPPLVLVPAAQAGVLDKRGRFREI